ncbi:MAG TPA: hypothetical protein VKB93_07595 [Thermoanaerobaculia bacterium]|nr:hypothetical protein [Thermoanaerobaculia bacterium]
MRRVLIIVVVAVLLAGAFTAWQVKKNMEEARRQAMVNALHENLAQMRGSIAKFRADNGRYPYSLDELVPRYMRRIPPDPMTGEASWRLTTEETVQPSDDFRGSSGGLKPAAPQTVVIDVHSSAPGYSND